VIFWTDPWCGIVLANHYQMSDDLVNWLPPKVSDYISNSQWNITDDIN